MPQKQEALNSHININAARKKTNHLHNCQGLYNTFSFGFLAGS